MGLFYKVVRFIAATALRLIFPVKIIGRENIPETGGLILCSNHISLMDPPYVSMTCKRQVHYMAKEELFRGKIFAAIIRGLGAFPIKRGAKDKSGIQTAVEIIEQGKVMGIFVEGTRSRDLRPQRAKSGVAMIAYQTGADVLPVAIYSPGRVRPFRRVTIRVGKVIPAQAFRFENGSPSEFKNAASMIMGKIKELWEVCGED